MLTFRAEKLVGVMAAAAWERAERALCVVGVQRIMFARMTILCRSYRSFYYKPMVLREFVIAIKVDWENMGDIGERQERLLDHDIAATPTGEHEVNLT